MIQIVALLLTTIKRQMTNLSWQMTHVMAMYARKWEKKILDHEGNEMKGSFFIKIPLRAVNAMANHA